MLTNGYTGFAITMIFTTIVAWFILMLLMGFELKKEVKAVYHLLKYELSLNEKRIATGHAVMFAIRLVITLTAAVFCFTVYSLI